MILLAPLCIVIDVGEWEALSQFRWWEFYSIYFCFQKFYFLDKLIIRKASPAKNSAMPDRKQIVLIGCPIFVV